MISTLKKLLFVFLLPVSLAAQDEGFLLCAGAGRYRVRSGVVAGFSIDASGALVPVPARLFGHPVTMLPTALRRRWPQTTRPIPLRHHERFYTECPARLAVFAIDPSTGALSPVPGSPFTIGQSTDFVVTSSPNGKFVYVLHRGTALASSDTITVFAVDTTTGALTLVPGSTVLAGKQSAPDSDGSRQQVCLCREFWFGHL